MRPGEEEGNSNRDCRALSLALAEAGFEFDFVDNDQEPEVTQDTSTQNEEQGAVVSNPQNETNSNIEISPEPSSTGSTSGTGRGFSRTHGSRRSTRRGRRGSYHRHRRRLSSRRGFKQRECNFAAAICSMLAVVSLCTALAEPRWFRLIGGGCNYRTLGVGQFFSFGSFEIQSHANSMCDNSQKSKYVYFPGSQNDCSTALMNCVDMEAVQVLKVIIVMCFFGALLSLAAFLLDLTGPTSTVLRAIRRHAVCSLLTVVCCVVIVGLCYWVSEVVAKIQKETNTQSNVVSVQFDISFYLVTAAGAISVIGSAFNLLKKHPLDESPDLQRLLDEIDHSSSDPPQLSPDYYAPMLNIPPPPAYSP